MKQLGTLLFLMLVGATILAAQDGALDVTFNTTGKVKTAVSLGDDIGYSVAIQSDGKIVVAGYSDTSGTLDFAVVRYNNNGTMDGTFGIGGKVTTAVGASTDIGRSVAIQSDAKIVVAGFSSISDNDFAVVRYNSDGILDDTFGNGGKVTTGVGGGNDAGYSVAIQSDGKIVVAGSANNGSNLDVAVVRYNSNGTLDNTFGSGGIVTTAIGSIDDIGTSVAIQSDGKIVVAGNSLNGSQFDFAVVRYNSNGTLDGTFGSGGKVTTAFGSGDDAALSVAIQSDGNIVVVGYSMNGSNADFALVRYSGNGTLDNTFGSDGKATTAVGSSDDVGFSVAIQSDGKIIVGGYSTISGNDDVAVVRYNSNGTLDNTFSGDGKATTGFSSNFDYGNSIAIQSDGKIAAAGYSAGAQNDFAVVRYTGSSGPLPVELTSFSAQLSGSGVELAWSTATEVNNYGFEVERRAAGGLHLEGGAHLAWSKLGFVEGNGTTNSPKEYSYTDDNLEAGKYVYRLKQIDRDGKFEYSQSVEVTVTRSAPIEFALAQNYPNPFNPSTNIRFEVPVSGFVSLKVYGVLGKEVASLVDEDKVAGNYEVKFNASNLSSGVYIARLYSNGKAMSRRMLLLK